MRKDVLRRVVKVIVPTFITLAIVGVLVYASWGRDIPVLNPSGTIADQQLILILITVGLGIFVIVPVFILLFTIAWKYRASNKKAQYEPELDHNNKLEAIWWGIPFAIIVVLAVITWVSTHALDPYKPLESDVTPVKVQVVSLNWKWLFLYPEYDIATVNYLNIPKDTPIELSLTSDAPMNSFWVPALAGQVYTMTGMATKLHFMASSTGTFKGVSSNISGTGYANMMFNVYSQTESEFQRWTEEVAGSPDQLTTARYSELVKPSTSEPEATYVLANRYLFHDIMMKYMGSTAEERPGAGGSNNTQLKEHGGMTH